MVQISGFHHVTLPTRDVELSGDWHERVFGFERVPIEEDEDQVRAVMLEHPEGMLLALHVSDDLIPLHTARSSAWTTARSLDQPLVVVWHAHEPSPDSHGSC